MNRYEVFRKNPNLIFLFIATWDVWTKQESCTKSWKSLTEDYGKLDFLCNQRLMYGQYLRIYSSYYENFGVNDWRQVANDIQIREIEIEFWAPRKYYSIKICTLSQTDMY